VNAAANGAATTTLLLAGDVMTGRGVDQALAQHCEPTLYEPQVRDARDYLRLAAAVSGALDTPLAPAEPWGDALATFLAPEVAARIVNLETAVTTCAEPWPGKGIHYRMHPDNVGVLGAARIDACALANNHVLDWGRDGLLETLAVLQRAGIASAGAGADADAAWAPAAIALPPDRRLLLWSLATPDSGVPDDWAAGRARPGVALLRALDASAAQRLAAAVASRRRAGDLVVISIHWGGNWVPRVPAAHRYFAQRLVELGAADVVHGHSAHHPLPAEVHAGRAILYGCGDLIDDYEGIGPHGPWRSDSGCLWRLQLDAGGRLRQLDALPLRRRRLRLERADPGTAAELRALLQPDAAAGWRDAPGGGWTLTPPH
jgi:poly-gamma-glutamate synthesis protein (capsule biosynthesis protein)